MARTAPAISTFNAGELDESLDPRVDVAKYYAGVRACENFVTQVQGGAVKRPGTRYVARSAASTTAFGSRLIPFEFNVEQAYILEFTTGGEVYFYTQGGPLQESFVVTTVAYGSPPAVVITVTGTSTLSSRWQIGDRVVMSGFTSTANQPLNYKTYTLTAVTTTTCTFVEALAPDTGDAAIGAGSVIIANLDYRYRVAHPYTGANAIQELQYAQSADVLYLAHRSVNPKKLSRTSGIAFSLADHITAAPFGSAGNYPGCVELYQQRLWYASTTNSPQQVWASESGDFTEFSAAATPADTDWFSFTLPEANRIEWLKAHDELIIGSAGGTFRVLGGDFGITYANVAPKPQTGHGANPVQAIRTDNSMIYIQRGGRRLRELSYEFAANKFLGTDLTKLAIHITGGRRVSAAKALKHLAYQSEPWPVVWGVTADRRLVAATYEKTEGVLGWHQHPMRRVLASGPVPEFVDSVAVIPIEGGEQVWLIATRYDSGTAYRTIEHIDDGFDPESPEDAYFVDSGLTFDRPFADWTINTLGPPLRISCGDVLKEWHSDGSAPAFVKLTHAGVSALALGKVYEVVGAYLNWGGNDLLDIRELDGSAIDASTWTTSAEDVVSGQLVPTALSGLDHLDGQVISVLADSAVIADLTVTSGAVTLPAQTYAGVLHAGVPPRARLKTMPLAVAGAPTIGKTKLWAEVEVLVKASGHLQVNGEDIPVRQVEDMMDTGPALYTGVLQMEDAGEPDEFGHIEIISEAPVPCELLAITGQASISGT